MVSRSKETDRTGVPELVDCPCMGMGKLVTVSEPRSRLSAQVTIKCDLGQSGDCFLPEYPEKDWNAWAIYQSLEGENGFNNNWATTPRVVEAQERTVRQHIAPPGALE